MSQKLSIDQCVCEAKPHECTCMCCKSPLGLNLVLSWLCAHCGVIFFMR